MITQNTLHSSGVFVPHSKCIGYSSSIHYDFSFSLHRHPFILKCSAFAGGKGGRVWVDEAKTPWFRLSAFLWFVCQKTFLSQNNVCRSAGCCQMHFAMLLCELMRRTLVGRSVTWFPHIWLSWADHYLSHSMQSAVTMMYIRWTDRSPQT